MKNIMICITLFACLIACKQEKQEKNRTIKKNTTPVISFQAEGELTFFTTSGDKRIVVEFADGPMETQRGLMYREFMEENHGMIFISEKKKIQSFWMKNTIIPLDIIFADDQKRIVSIAKNTEPFSLDPILSENFAKYVVEVNAGFCDKYEINKNDRLEFFRY